VRGRLGEHLGGEAGEVLQRRLSVDHTQQRPDEGTEQRSRSERRPEVDDAQATVRAHQQVLALVQV
jgi:hypothetical protein